MSAVTRTLRCQAVGYPGMRRDSPNMYRVVCSCGFESRPVFAWALDCPRFEDSQQTLAARVEHWACEAVREEEGS